MITVKELIEALQKFPPEKKVVFARGEWGYGSKARLEEIAVKPQSDPEYFWEEFYPHLSDPEDPPCVDVVVL